MMSEQQLELLKAVLYKVLERGYSENINIKTLIDRTGEMLVPLLEKK